jgi:hypothetical protein
VDVGGFSGMLLVVGVESLLRMKASISACLAGVSGLLSRIGLFSDNSSMLEFVEDISLVIRRFFGGVRVIIGRIC